MQVSGDVNYKTQRTPNPDLDKTNSYPVSEASWSRVNKKLKLVQEGHQLWQKSSSVEEVVTAANSSAASGEFS